MTSGAHERGGGPWPELARRLTARPLRALLLAALTGGAALAFAGARLEVHADRMDLLGRQHAYARHFAELQDDFGDVDSIVVLVEAGTRAEARAFAGDLAARAAQAPGAPFRGAFFRVPDEALRGKALLFLSLTDLVEVEARLATAKDALAAAGSGGAGALLEHAAGRARALVAAGGAGPPGRTADLELLQRLVEAVAGAASAEGRAYAPVWHDLIPAGVQARDGYVWTRDGRLVLLVEPRGRAGAARLDAVATLRALAAEVCAARPGVRVGFTGGPVLEADEQATFVRDAQRATVASLVALALLLVASLRRLSTSAVVLFGLGWAVAVALGLAALWPGHLNLITVVVGALLLGVGADGALHLVTRHDEARASGAAAGTPSVVRALADVGAGATVAGLTVALAFMATLFTDVEAIRELGLLAAGGLLLCLAATLLIIPPLLAWFDPPGRPPRHRPAGWHLSTLDALIERRPRHVLGLACALAVGGAALALAPGADGRRRLRYEPNLLRLQAQGLESVRLAGEVLADETVTGMFAAIVVPDVPSLVRVTAAVRALPTVARAESLLDVVPPEQEAKLVVVRQVAGTLEGLTPAFAGALTGSATERLARAEAGAEALQAALETAARGALDAGRPDDAATILRLQERLEALAPLADPAERARRAAGLVAWEDALRADLALVLEQLREECLAQPVTADDLPAEVRGRFVGKTGRLLLRVYPAVDVWDPAARRRFLDDLGGVVPDVGGFPRQLHESDRLLAGGVRRAALLSLAFMALVLLAHFRSLVVPLATAVVVAVGGGWALGALALFDIELNPANLLALPLALGVGVGHVIHLARRERAARARASVGGPPAVVGTSTGRAVVLSGLAALVAFGALGFSDHRGLATLGASACLGAAACLASALVVLPALLRVRGGPWQPPPFGGVRGPKTAPGGGPTRPAPQEPPADDDLL